MNIKVELAALERMTTAELAGRYAELTGEPVRTRHRAYLIRKVAWRLQANAESRVSQRARRRAAAREPIRLVVPFLSRIITYATNANRSQNAALM